MSRILSQDEMDALLTAVPNREGATSETGSRAVPAMTYDFRRPDRVSKDTIRSLHLLHDRFSRNVTSSLSAYLRTGVEVSQKMSACGVIPWTDRSLILSLQLRKTRWVDGKVEGEDTRQGPSGELNLVATCDHNVG